MSDTSEDLLQNSIEKIESAYEYMLAYAAQGRKDEPAEGDASNTPSIRNFLENMLWGIENITQGFTESAQALNNDASVAESLEHFKSVLTNDAESASAVVKMALKVPSLSSQLIDNLNASTHLRCLLTDIFVLDEVLRIHLQNQPE
jgi:hypothetical protein